MGIQVFYFQNMPEIDEQVIHIFRAETGRNYTGIRVMERELNNT